MVTMMASAVLASSFAAINLTNWTMNARPEITQKAISEIGFVRAMCAQYDARLFIVLTLLWVVFLGCAWNRRRFSDAQWLVVSEKLVIAYLFLGGLAIVYIAFLTFK